MIFVTLGTHDKPFNRLLEAVQKQIDLGNINDKVIVQAGATKFVSKDMEIFDLISMTKFDELVSKCDLLITHGGVGTIMTGLKKGKKVIACARLAKYKEVVNDHQKQIIENFDKTGYIIGVTNLDDLDKALKRVKDFKPKRFVSNTENMIKLVKEKIEE